MRNALEVKRVHDGLRRENHELQLTSRSDSLTGLYNRRHLQEKLTALASAARRHHILRVVAERLRSTLRAEDVIFDPDETMLVDAADTALYRAKGDGRNRVSG